MYDAHADIQNQQGALFDEMGAFFAISNKEFNESIKEGVQYVQGFCGILVPKVNSKVFHERLNEIHKQAKERDLKENGMAVIMQREFASQECGYTWHYRDAKEALSHFNFSEADYIEQFEIFKQKENEREALEGAATGFKL